MAQGRHTNRGCTVEQLHLPSGVCVLHGHSVGRPRRDRKLDTRSPHLARHLGPLRRAGRRQHGGTRGWLASPDSSPGSRRRVRHRDHRSRPHVHDRQRSQTMTQEEPRSTRDLGGTSADGVNENNSTTHSDNFHFVSGTGYYMATRTRPRTDGGQQVIDSVPPARTSIECNYRDPGTEGWHAGACSEHRRTDH